jgi:hypothetical protein
MRLFSNTLKYHLKALCTGAYGIIFFLLALTVAVCPFLGLIIPDAPVPIGWIDEDDTEFSHILLNNVEALNVVWVTFGDKDTLVANLQTGRLEGVFVIKDGFEDTIKSGEFEGALQLLRSPYSTAAGVISESVGSEALRLWLACSSANEARTLGDDALYQKVFDDTIVGADDPILKLERENLGGDTGQVTPLLDAAYSSLYLLCGVASFFMLTGIAMARKGADFSMRLVSRAFSIERFRLATGLADTLYILPCVLVPLVAFGLAGEGQLIAPLLLSFLLYVFAFGGIAGLLALIHNQTAMMLSICVVTIANVMLSSMLVPLPASGLFASISHVLPARWLSAADMQNPMLSVVGLAVSAAVYNALPFILRRKESGT